MNNILGYIEIRENPPVSDDDINTGKQEKWMLLAELCGSSGPEQERF